MLEFVLCQWQKQVDSSIVYVYPCVLWGMVCVCVLLGEKAVIFLSENNW